MPVPTSSGRDPNLARLVFAAMMVFWLLYPVFEQSRSAQDAIPLVAAGELVHDHPDAVYLRPGAGLFDTKPEFFAESCKYYDSPAQCEQYVVAFVSPPPALPLVVPLSKLGDNAFPLMRVLGALALVGAMVVLWRRLTPLLPGMAWALAIGAVLLTPLMTAPVGLGQSSPLLFLAAALPITAMDRPGWRPIAFGLLMGVIVALKAFPIALLVVPLVDRRWRPVVWPLAVVATLVLAGLAIAPFHLWHDFLASRSGLSSESYHNPYNSSLEGALGQLGVGSSIVVGLARVVLAVPVVVVARRVWDVDVRWACAWPVMLVLFPQVWGHYSFVLVAAVGAVLAWRPDRERWLWSFPAACALTVPIGLIGGSGHGSPLLQLGCNLAALGLVLGIASRPAAAEPAPTARTSMV